jgi:hypothetical protein
LREIAAYTRRAVNDTGKSRPILLEDFILLDNSLSHSVDIAGHSSATETRSAPYFLNERLA